MVTRKPLEWLPTKATPFAILGDRRWRNYRLDLDVRFAEHGAVQLAGRVGRQHGRSPERIDGYYLRVGDSGAWALVEKSSGRRPTTLARGRAKRLGLHRWHHLRLAFAGRTITAALDGRRFASLRDTSLRRGLVGIGVDGYQADEFDNLSIT
jgi:hypothetical protein